MQPQDTRQTQSVAIKSEKNEVDPETMQVLGHDPHAAENPQRTLTQNSTTNSILLTRILTDRQWSI